MPGAFCLVGRLPGVSLAVELSCGSRPEGSSDRPGSPYWPRKRLFGAGFGRFRAAAHDMVDAVGDLVRVGGA
jgi:hypothetical protein